MREIRVRLLINKLKKNNSLLVTCTNMVVLHLTKCNIAANILDLDEKFSTFYKRNVRLLVQVQNLNRHDSKTNPKNEKLWNNRKILVEKD